MMAAICKNENPLIQIIQSVIMIKALLNSVFLSDTMKPICFLYQGLEGVSNDMVFSIIFVIGNSNIL